ncbi:MAG: hypothetical protein WBO10_14865 [Pyrinomonadaceae bacterium]
MDIDAGILITLFSQIREWLNRADTKSTKRQAEVKSALKSIYLAAFETKSYLAAIHERNEQQNVEIEKSLSRLWADAAVELRTIDKDLSDRCLVKGRYWSNPSEWSREEIDESRINVNEVFEDARGLLFT